MNELNYLREVTDNLDGPACKCGAIMVREAERKGYWTCLSCGNTAVQGEVK